MMHFLLSSTLAVSVIFSLFSGAASLNNLVERTPPSDLCGEVKAELTVPHPSSPGNYIAVGGIGTFPLDGK
jgi:hypothetical protein